MRIITAIGAALLAACATYAPKSLDDADIAAVLASPDRAVLARDAASLAHPQLPPVKLDFSQPLSEDEVAVIAVLANPDLRAQRAQQQLAQAQVFSAGLLPDPQLSVGFDRVLRPQDQGLVTAYTGALTLDLFAGLLTRPLERAVAQGKAQQVRLDLAWAEWQAAGKARLQLRRIYFLEQGAQLAQAAADAADAALARTLNAAAHGDLKADEVQARRILFTDWRTRALTAARELAAARLELNQVLGFRPEESLSLAPPSDSAWTHADAESLFEQARRERLDLRALEAGYSSQQAALHRAVLGQFPKLSLTLTRARDTSAVHTFGPAVAFDLPLWNRNRGAIAVAGAGREQARAEYAARLYQTRADIAALVDALDHDEAARATLAAQLPAVERVAQALRDAAARGDVTRTEADTASLAAQDKQLTLIALAQSLAEQRLALLLATGAPLSTAVPSTAETP